MTRQLESKELFYRRNCYLHFAKRVRGRLGQDADPEALWIHLIRSIRDQDDQAVTFIARVNKSGRRLWRFEAGGRACFAIYDHDLDCPVTVLTAEEGSTVARRDNGDTIPLEHYL